MNNANKNGILASFFLVAILMGVSLFAYWLKPTKSLPYIGDVSELYDKKWVFQYAIENNKKTLEYQHLIDKEIWIKFSSQIHQEQPCKDIFGTHNISANGRCFSGYDGCNYFWGIYSISENGNLIFEQYYQELVGCPILIVTQINPETQESEIFFGPVIYNSDPFTKAVSSAVSIKLNASELKLYYPSTQQNYLLFHLEETP